MLKGNKRVESKSHDAMTVELFDEANIKMIVYCNVCTGLHTVA
jgi:hypothetical protein